MILIYTGREAIDEALEKKLKELNAQVVYYYEYLLSNKDGDIVITSTDVEVPISFPAFLYTLRCNKKRIILLADSHENENIKYALALGVYDILFNPIDENKIKTKINNPSTFLDVEMLYRKHFGNNVEGLQEFATKMKIELNENNSKIPLLEAKTKESQQQEEEEKVEAKEDKEPLKYPIFNVNNEKHNVEIDAYTAIGIIKGILTLLGSNTNKSDIVELLLELESRVIEVIL